MELLASKRSDDEISGELAELVGYDELEFVTGVVQSRHQLVSQVRLRVTFERRLTAKNRARGPPFNIIREGARAREKLDRVYTSPL